MSLKFEVDFLTPFVISSGKALDGLDHTIDEETPFPSSAVKGLLRAHALHWLGLPKTLVGEVFGTARKGSDWIFSDVAVERVGTGVLQHGVEPFRANSAGPSGASSPSPGTVGANPRSCTSWCCGPRPATS